VKRLLPPVLVVLGLTLFGSIASAAQPLRHGLPPAMTGVAGQPRYCQ
jgi:hypothetical protein